MDIMVQKYINLDLDDPRAVKVAEVIGNKTCKDIIALLADKELSEGDIAKELDIPLNTVGYNIKKLLESGLIEKSKVFFWSVKGKRIPTYKLSNKKILISPKSVLRGVLPALVISALFALAVKMFSRSNYGVGEKLVEKGVEDSGISLASEKAASLAVSYSDAAYSSSNYGVFSSEYLWLWFLLGALMAVLVILIWNWRKI